MNIVVTGSSGFIGHHLVNSLVDQGHTVIGIDVVENEYAEDRCTEFIMADLRETNRVVAKRLLSYGEIHQWFALAADMGGLGYMDGMDAPIMANNVRINTISAHLAVQLSANQGFPLRYVFGSSAVVYPDVEGKLSEDMATGNPNEGGYGMEKWFTEQLIGYLVSGYGDVQWLNAVPVRIHNTYGPEGAWNNGKEKAPAAAIRKIAYANMVEDVTSVEIWGDGTAQRSFLYIDDCVIGLQRIANSTVNDPINLGSDELVSIQELYDLVMDVIGCEVELESVPGPVGVQSRCSDNRYLKTVTGWEPQVSLLEGLRKTVPWITNQLEKEFQEALPLNTTGLDI